MGNPDKINQLATDDRFRILKTDTVLMLNEVMNADFQIQRKETTTDMCEVAERIFKQGEKEAHRKDALRLQEKEKDATFIADVLGESVEQIKIWLGLTLA